MTCDLCLNSFYRIPTKYWIQNNFPSFSKKFSLLIAVRQNCRVVRNFIELLQVQRY